MYKISLVFPGSADSKKKLELCSLLGVTFVTVEHFWPVENKAYIWKMAEQVSIIPNF